MYDLIIVGGGPAGLAAAAYAAQKRLNTLLVAKHLGGQTSHRLALPWVEEAGEWSVRGAEVVRRLQDELAVGGTAYRQGAVDSIRENGETFLVTVDGEELPARAVIVASGVRQQPLGVPGEDEYYMRGLSYSTMSYAPLFEGRTVAVIGEGELAVRSAAELMTLAKDIYFVCSHSEMLVTPLGPILKSAPNVRILEGCVVKSIRCTTGDGFANCLSIEGLQGEVEELQVDGVFVEKGLAPNSEMVRGLAATDPAGRIVVDALNSTSVDGLFAAGDVTNLYAEQVLVAVGEGAKAALSAYDYLLPSLARLRIEMG